MANTTADSPHNNDSNGQTGRPLPLKRAPFTEKRYILTLAFVVSLFMLWGIAITMGDVLNRHFQQVLHVSKSRSALVQFSMFGAYAVMGIPAGLFMKKFGYKNGVLLGLLLYATGAFLFVPAANAGSFLFFRIALFILACGLATMETVAHPFVAVLGPQSSSAQRLNFAQGFNGLGGVLGSALGGYFILRATHSNNLESVKILYTCIGTLLVIIAATFFFLKVPVITETPSVNAGTGALITATVPSQLKHTKKLFQHTHFKWAIAAQFFNVAAQAGTWAFFINYGIEKMHFTSEKAAYFFSFSMILKMGGRFAGAYAMRFIEPNKLLGVFALCNIAMCLLVAQSFGWFSFIALIMLNFFFSIMVPTIYSLGLNDLGPHKQQAASFIVLGVAGGAVFPTLMGLIANHNIAAAYYLPIICYLFIALFAFKLSKIR
ncbi:MAG: sugar MFS transporter [Ferruginibacter sp.]